METDSLTPENLFPICNALPFLVLYITSGVQNLHKTSHDSPAYTKDVIPSLSEACGPQLAQSRPSKSCPSRSPVTDAQVFQQKVQECLQPQELGSEPTPESEVVFLLTESWL